MDTNLNHNPKVSVIMPVWNGEKYLRDSVESILRQSFRDFEFLIINDGSTDNTGKILDSFTDRRVKIFTNDRNLGMAANFNRLLELARGKYLARMDADDVSLPNRLAVLVKFMDRHPEIGVCGSLVKNIGRGAGETSRRFTEPAEIEANLLFGTSISHPSVIMRREIFLKNNLLYDGTFNPADDYDLWVKASAVTMLANIPKVLLLYRVHEESISSVKAGERQSHAGEIRLRQLKNLGLSPTAEELQIHKGAKPEGLASLEWLKKTEQWLAKISEANEKVGRYDKRALDRVLASRWFNAAYCASAGGWQVWRKWRSSPIYRKFTVGEYPRLAKLAFKCLLSK